MSNLINKLELDSKKIILLILTSAVLLYLDFSAIMNWQLKNIKSLDSKIIKTTRDLDTLNREVVRLRDLKNKMASVPQGQSSAEKRVLLDSEVPTLLQQIYDIANRQQVDIVQIKPSREAEGRQEEKGAAANKKFSTLLINLDLFCDYHHLGIFISRLEGMNVFIEVQGLKIGGQQTDYFKQKASLVLKAYVKR